MRTRLQPGFSVRDHMQDINRLYNEGRRFEKQKSTEDRKAKGVFYTPLEVVEYMVNNSLANMDLVKNPFIRILDLSCGAGYFLLKSFEVLKQIFEEKYDQIMLAHPELQDKLDYEDIGRFIVENNIWGADIDPEAVLIAREALNKAAGCSCKSNIICEDSLLANNHNNEGFGDKQFDCIIGNPPYIGHKGVPNEYKTFLYERYSSVYRDKSDISYCFFQRGLELLKSEGRLSFITSRYFMEGPSAERLRSFLGEYSVEEIVDFGDCKVFADAGVAVCIVALKKQPPMDKVKIIKFRAGDNTTDSLKIDKENVFYIAKENLSKEGWLLLEPMVQELYQKIAGLGTHELGEVFDSYQGIITGCDKAFVLSKAQAKELKIETELLKPWIKNSNVDEFFIKPAELQLIYSDLIDDTDRYPNAIAFIGMHKERLQQRRECLRGVREWYQLQWGRTSGIFENEKLVYPYKASKNRFAVDKEGLYCSADVYSLQLKKEYKVKFSLDYIAAMLNSKVIEFYFKCYAKKISPSAYDYYPNKVLKIKLILKDTNQAVVELVNKLKRNQNTADRQCILQAIDREIYKMYNLNESQIELIEKSAGE